MKTYLAIERSPEGVYTATHKDGTDRFKLPHGHHITSGVRSTLATERDRRITAGFETWATNKSMSLQACSLAQGLSKDYLWNAARSQYGKSYRAAKLRRAAL